MDIRTAEYQTVLDRDLEFTEVYKRYMDEHVAVREAHCLRVLYPDSFRPIRQGDLFAGRSLYGQVGLGLEVAAGGPGYYCHEEQIEQELEKTGSDAGYRKRVEEMLAFWQEEATIEGRLVSSLPLDVLEGTTNVVAEMGGRLAGVTLDFARLVNSGLPGLAAEVAEGKARAEKQGGDVELYRGWQMALGLFSDLCEYYAVQARELAAKAKGEYKAELEEICRILGRIRSEKPATMREAIQLFWLYALISGVVNYGRQDVYLGDFLARDLERGELTEEKALKLLQSLWQLMADRKIIFNGRVIIGGKGRPNESNADRFAMLAMEATRTVIEIEPQLTLRFHAGQDAALMKKGLDVIGEGRVYPMLYNDDINVPAVAKSFVVAQEEAEQYYPYGCGEYALDHISFGSPNCGFNMLKALELTLHNGINATTGEKLGLALGEFSSFKTFDEILAAYKKQVEHFVTFLATRHELEYKAERESAAFLYASMLMDNCVARGKSIVDGGPRYSGGIIETFGMVNAADSLSAIKELVYDKKLLSHHKMLAALKADFQGYEAEWKLMRDASKYGNDDHRADEMMQEVSDHVALFTRSQAERVGLDYFLVVNINNKGNIEHGKGAAASADGRRRGKPVANANNPTAGNDKKGVTAFLNSISKVDPSVHAGYVQNMKFSREMFKQERKKLEALLEGYWARGGTQAMITVVGRGDLEAAMKEPEKYANLIVRVGGFSARFVELERELQEDILKRTLN